MDRSEKNVSGRVFERTFFSPPSFERVSAGPAVGDNMRESWIPRQQIAPIRRLHLLRDGRPSRLCVLAAFARVISKTHPEHSGKKSASLKTALHPQPV